MRGGAPWPLRRVWLLGDADAEELRGAIAGRWCELEVAAGAWDAAGQAGPGPCADAGRALQDVRLVDNAGPAEGQGAGIAAGQIGLVDPQAQRGVRIDGIGAGDKLGQV